MDQLYSANGIQFRYPDDWELTEEEQGRDLVVSIMSPETSFWTLSMLAGCPEPERVLGEILETFRGEYAELDEYEVEVRVQGTDCAARDLQFMQYELINSAFLRVFLAGARTAVILYQGTDHELEFTRPILENISASFQWDDSLF